MKIEFKLPEASHKETFEALEMMLDVIGRKDTLNETVHYAMSAHIDNLPEFVNINYIQNGFQVEFIYYRGTGKISLNSRPVQ